MLINFLCHFVPNDTIFRIILCRRAINVIKQLFNFAHHYELMNCDPRRTRVTRAMSGPELRVKMSGNRFISS
jgi:hypothetical protein